MSNLKIETLRGLNESQVSFCGERGGILTSLILKNKEIFYFDPDTFFQVNESIRGGIPILFPNAGELINNTLYLSLKRHGFAREMRWTISKKDNCLKESFFSNEETLKIFPYNFEFNQTGSFQSDGSFTLNQEVINKEKHKSLPLAMGLHPYLKVNNTKKGYIKFNFPGGREVEDQISVWSNGGTIYIDNPKLKDAEALMEIEIPSLGTIIINASIEYETIWIWSMPGKDFICIEPMMRGLNGLIDDPYLLKPQNQFKASINFKLK